MNQESDLLTAVRESFAGAELQTPLDATIRRGRELRARRRMAGIAATTAIAGGAALTVAGLGLNAGPAAPPTDRHGPVPSTAPARLAAWTVTQGPGNTVTVLVRQLSDPAGMRRTLRADGVPAAVAFQGGMLSDTPPLPRSCRNVGMSDEANARLQAKILGRPAAAGADFKIALVIHKAEIPKGIGLNLTVQSSGSGWGWSLGLVQATKQCTGS